MGDKQKFFDFSHEETVPTSTIGAAFVIAVLLGVIVVSGVLLKPYEAREVVESLHERIMLEKEYRDLSRMSYNGDKASFAESNLAAFSTSQAMPSTDYAITVPAVPADKPTHKTERAESFDRLIKSDEYWKSLQASIAGTKADSTKTSPVVIPPVIVGSAE